MNSSSDITELSEIYLEAFWNATPMFCTIKKQ